jgi:hypothetical protein
MDSGLSDVDEVADYVSWFALGPVEAPTLGEWSYVK